MKKTINFYEFSRWFEEHRPNNFSYEGRKALFDYLEEYEDGTGEEIEFDPIALCCEYTEYEDLNEFKVNYTCDQYQDLQDWDELEDYTMTIPLELGTDADKPCIILNF
jgi:hypothetical protein